MPIQSSIIKCRLREMIESLSVEVKYIETRG